MSETTKSFVRSFVSRFPEFRGVLEEHLEDNFGELLPHLFFGDVTRYVVERFQSASRLNDASTLVEVQRLLDFLEAAYATEGDEVEELLAVSFLEALPRPLEEGHEIRRLLGPRLACQLEMIG